MNITAKINKTIHLNVIHLFNIKGFKIMVKENMTSFEESQMVEKINQTNSSNCKFKMEMLLI